MTQVADLEPAKIVLVGVSHYATSYSQSINTLCEEGFTEYSGVVIRSPDKYPEAVADYNERGIKIYNAYDEMLAAEQGNTEIVALPVGILDHAEMAIAAMEAGYDVVLEKPTAATVQDVDAIIETERRTGHFCVIGYQNQSKYTVRELKRRVCDGKLGEILDIRVAQIGSRDDAYYARNRWAGRFKIGDKYVLDGPTNNPVAHYLFNALYWASPEWGRADQPARVRGEIYKAHPIEGEDTAGLEIETEGGTRIVFLTTVAGWKGYGPVTHIYGTKGEAFWSYYSGCLFWYHNRSHEYIGDDGERPHDEVFRNAVRYLRGLDEELNCPVEMTRVQTLALNGGYESCGTIHRVPDEYITREPRGDSMFTAINGIDDVIHRCRREGKLYSDAGVPWAHPSDWFDLSGYDHFAMELS